MYGPSAALRGCWTEFDVRRLRMRAEYVHSTKDTGNLSTWGAWQYFTVRK
ncbi:hypothetical protein [Streptomyces sp. NRRL B-3229]|nr:hypothetical protein [Streptomyces sp. NRRL B-3229]